MFVADCFRKVKSVERKLLTHTSWLFSCTELKPVFSWSSLRNQLFIGFYLNRVIYRSQCSYVHEGVNHIELLGLSVTHRCDTWGSNMS